MRRSRNGYGQLLVVALVLAVIGAACGDPNVGPGPDDPAISVTTRVPITGAPTTAVSSPDGLECESEARMMGHGDPDPEFAGFATPEEAVLSAASTFSVSGTPEYLEGDTWVIMSDAGLTVARTDVGPWKDGWIAGDVLACDFNEMSHGSGTEPGVVDDGSATPTLSGADTVSTTGLGPVKIGMTVEEASLAAGRAIEGPHAPDCFYVEPAGLEGVGFMITNESIARVDITSGPITTTSGAGIGMTEQEIKDLFPGQIEVEPHKYSDVGHYLVFVPSDPADADKRLIFETDGATVTSYRAGTLPEVGWVEGCS